MTAGGEVAAVRCWHAMAAEGLPVRVGESESGGVRGDEVGTGGEDSPSAANGSASVQVKSEGNAEGGEKRCESTATVSPAERKRRRLESNRAAAKRAYYRRQSKSEQMQQENLLLRSQLSEEQFKVTIFKNLLRRLGVNPEVALAAITGHTVPTESLVATPGHGRSKSMQELNAAGSVSLGSRYSSTPSLESAGTTNDLSISSQTNGTCRGVSTDIKQGKRTVSGPPS